MPSKTVPHNHLSTKTSWQGKSCVADQSTLSYLVKEERPTARCIFFAFDGTRKVPGEGKGYCFMERDQEKTVGCDSAHEQQTSMGNATP